MRASFISFVVVVRVALCAAPARALPPGMGMLVRETNESGFTAGDLLAMNIGTVARHLLLPGTLSRISADIHRPPHRGVQLELFTPGDVGVTIHFRW